MKDTLLLPCAGRSRRYPGVRPKWMLTTPEGTLAIQRAQLSVPMDRIGRCIIAILAEHDERFGASKVIRRAFGDSVEIVTIERDTEGPAETVAMMVEQAGVKGPMIVKDADSFFAPTDMPHGSFIAVCDLRSHLDISSVGAKSFALINEQGLICNIIEKEVSSNFVSAGLYAFSDADKYLSFYRAVRDETGGREIFISHVIAEALRRGEVFAPHYVSGMVDVGTLTDWHAYASHRRLLLIDIDGVVFENQSEFFPPYWGDPVKPITDNVNHLRKLQDEGAQLVFVTSRTEKYRDATLQALASVGLHPHAMVMGCVHSSRVLINDYANSNPYPSAVAINLPRNQPVLPTLLT